jgi:hypothetical protein
MPYAPGAINHCKVHFNQVLLKHMVRSRENGLIPTILALGNLPLTELTGVTGLATDKQNIDQMRGYVLPAKDYSGVWVVGSYAPEFIRRGKAALYPALMDDISKALAVASGQFTSFKGGKDFKELSYILHPSLSDAVSFVRMVKENINLPLGMDIETPNTAETDEDEREELEGHKITLIQFSLRKRHGIAIPFCEPYLKVIQEILNCENIKLGFNWWNFDAPRVVAEGMTVRGIPHDLMVMFAKAFGPGLKKGLQNVASHANFPFPWKHYYGENLEWYGCADVDALHWIWEWLPGIMKEMGSWRGYEEQVYQIKPILNRASEVGVPVDETARQVLLVDMVMEQKKVLQTLETLLPIDTRDVKPKAKDKVTKAMRIGYVKPPLVLRQLVMIYREKKERLEAEGKIVVSFEKFASRNGFIKRDGRWCMLMPLKTSKEQIIRYIKWKKADLLKEKI